MSVSIANSCTVRARLQRSLWDTLRATYGVLLLVVREIIIESRVRIAYSLEKGFAPSDFSRGYTSSPSSSASKSSKSPPSNKFSSTSISASAVVSVATSSSATPLLVDGGVSPEVDVSAVSEGSELTKYSWKVELYITGTALITGPWRWGRKLIILALGTSKPERLWETDHDHKPYASWLVIYHDKIGWDLN